MKERPIIFSGPMVRAIRGGRKTQTRQVVEPQPPDDIGRILGPEEYEPVTVDRYSEMVPGKPVWGIYDEDGEWGIKCPYRPGDLLFVRLWIRVTDVRVERLKEITEEDCFAEGIDSEGEVYDEGERFQSAGSPVTAAHYTFTTLWDSINAKRGYGWDKNPWVWVITFEVVKNGGI